MSFKCQFLTNWSQKSNEKLLGVHFFKFVYIIYSMHTDRASDAALFQFPFSTCKLLYRWHSHKFWNWIFLYGENRKNASKTLNGHLRSVLKFQRKELIHSFQDLYKRAHLRRASALRNSAAGMPCRTFVFLKSGFSSIVAKGWWPTSIAIEVSKALFKSMVSSKSFIPSAPEKLQA